MEDTFIKIHRWLYPFSFMYGIGVRVRNKMFDWGILQSRRFDIPIISIGNITVGGTGKTPQTEYLIKLLREEFRIAVLSRGYKRKSKGFFLAKEDTPAQIIGDEPYQMKKKFPEICMAVDKNRCHGIDELLKGKQDNLLDVILLDDAFQHRYVQSGINILLIDFYRLICDDTLLPAGRLREPASSKHRANIVVVTKCPTHIKPMDFRIISKQLNLYPYQRLYFTSFRYKELYPLFSEKELPTRTLDSLKVDEQILLLTGIASPQQLIQDLESYNKNIHALTFEDHHNFTKNDLRLLKKTFDELPGNKKIIITTEKDAARIIQYSYLDDSLKEAFYTLPIEVEFLQEQQDTFNENIIGYVRKNKRNSILSKRKNEHKS